MKILLSLFLTPVLLGQTVQGAHHVVTSALRQPGDTTNCDDQCEQVIWLFQNLTTSCNSITTRECKIL